MELIFNSTQIKSATRAFGDFGERLAAEYLRRNDFRLVCANFQVPIGRNMRGVLVKAEIDLVAMEGETLCFIEVKTRRSADFAAPETAVDLRKQRQITRAANAYINLFHLSKTQIRFDVAAIVSDGKSHDIRYLRDFWTRSKFRKKRWANDAYFD